MSHHHLQVASPALSTREIAGRAEAVYTSHTQAAVTVTAAQRQVGPLPIVRCFGGAVVFLDARRPRDWMHNRVAGLTEEDLDHLPDIDALFASADVPLRVETLPAHLTPRMGQALAAHGLVVTHHDAAYAGHPLGGAPVNAWPPTVEIRRAQDDGELGQYLQARQAAFDWPTLAPEVAAVHVDRLRQPDLTHFTAWVQGALAGAGTLYVQGRTGYLALAGTLPVFRGQGVQQALLQARVRHAAGLGCDLVVGMTGVGETSGRNMQRVGLGLVQIRSIWTRSAAALAQARQ